MSFLQDFEEFNLNRDRDIANFIDKDRARGLQREPGAPLIWFYTIENRLTELDPAAEALAGRIIKQIGSAFADIMLLSQIA